ncbi:hypothetical protein SAMN04487770_12376 [Butyrivibrio sp. ob235]|nr:hypothetical protein SAMN04487770_12376 [Butyrivibrio sp. ob235]
MNMTRYVETIDCLVANPQRKGFPGCLKFWLPKYIVKSIRVRIKDTDK